jgi:hypothetical protein
LVAGGFRPDIENGVPASKPPARVGASDALDLAPAEPPAPDAAIARCQIDDI